MAKGERAVSRTNRKVIINIEEASKLISDVEIDLLLRTIKRIESVQNMQDFIHHDKEKNPIKSMK